MKLFSFQQNIIYNFRRIYVYLFVSQFRLDIILHRELRIKNCKISMCLYHSDISVKTFFKTETKQSSCNWEIHSECLNTLH